MYEVLRQLMTDVIMRACLESIFSSCNYYQENVIACSFCPNKDNH